MSEIEQLRAELNEIGEFQNDVRDLVIKLTGAPSDAIDGKGSDAGWQEFTLAEISQGIAFVKDELERVKAQNAAMREALQGAKSWIWSLSSRIFGERRRDDYINSQRAWSLIMAALQSDAGRDHIAKDSVRPVAEALRDCVGFIERIARDPSAWADKSVAAKVDSALSCARQVGLLEDGK